MNYVKLIGIAGLLSITSSCNQQTNKFKKYEKIYGISMNEIRLKNGLIRLTDSFKPNKDVVQTDIGEFYYIRWINRAAKGDCCVVWSKDQYILNDSLVAEVDHIHGKRINEVVDGKFREGLARNVIFYNYTYWGHNYFKGTLDLISTDRLGMLEDDTITHLVSDSLVKAWNINK